MPHINPSGWVYRALGANCLESEGKKTPLERKTAAILSYLALEGPTSRSKLAGLLWPDSEEATARNNLSQTLRRFRQLSGEPLLVAGDALELGPTLTVDAARLRAAALSGDAAGVSAHTGELLAPFDYDDLPEFNEWLLSTRESLGAFFEEALQTLVSASEAQGQHGEALRYAERLVGRNPVSELAHRHVMRLHYLLGDRPAALRAYHRCQEVLKRELAVAPLPETVALARLIEQGRVPGAAPRARPLPPQVLRPPVLVGREAAWALLETAWARGQTIYVTGEPGIGKTRLVQEFVASKGRGLYLPAQPGYQDVLFAGAAELARARIAAAPEVQLPDWVARELSRILPEFRFHDPLPPLRSEDDKLRFYQAYHEMVKRTGAGFVATISDDTQYYDPATVELGGFMIAQGRAQASARPAGEAIPRYVIVYRRGELTPAVQVVIDQLVASEVAARVELGPLDVQETTSLLASLELPTLTDGVTPALAEAVYRRTGGNTLFVLETLRHLLETDTLSTTLPERLPLPHRVSATVEGRLARLSPPAQRAVQAAAVLGSDFSAELIARVLGSDPLTLLDVWGELERAHIFSEDRFSHDLIYEAVAASLPQQVAHLLNQRCAEVLAQSDATPARVARHHLAGGDDEKAAPYLLRAAERAKDALRLVEAAERYDRAGGIFERLGRRAEAFEAYRAALKLRLEFDPGDHEGALTKLRADAGTPLMRALVWRLAAEQRLRRGDYAATEAAARSGLAELGAHPDERARTELLTFLAGALARQGREAESSAVLAELRTLTEALEGGTWLSVQLSHAASVLDDLGRSREAFGLYRRALGMQSRPRDRPLQLADYAYSLLGYGDAARALEALQEARARLEGVTDVPVVAAMVTTYLGATYHLLGRYAEALATFDAFLEGSGRHHAVQREGALVRRARLYLTLGAPQKAEADLVAAQRVPAPRHMYQVHLETTLGRLRTLQGNHEAAAEAFARVEARLREAASPRMRALVRFGQATALPRAARLDLAEEVLALSQKLELPSLDIGAHTLYAQRLLAAGDAAGARSHTRKAVTLMNTYTSGYLYPGEVLLTHVQALRAADDPEARGALARTLAFLTETALPNVPEAYRQSFLEGAVNRGILTAARRFGLGPSERPGREGL